MMFQRLIRTDPEKVFIVVKNSYSTAAVTRGQVVCFDYTTDVDGVGVTQPSTALLKHAAGIVADASIAAGDYGLVQVYGHNAGALVDGTTGVGVGVPLKTANGVFNLVIAGVTATGASYPFVCGEAYTTGAAAAKRVFLRCL
jgi:hypothetical protein